MKQELPPWSYPFLLALLGIVVYVGNFTPTWAGILAGESIGFIGYLLVRARMPARSPTGRANVISLFPGHLLLLFAIGVLSHPPVYLLAAWMVIPAASLAYDLAARSGARKSILAGLYCIIWADLFAILERVIGLGRELSGKGELILAVVFVVVGVPFLWTGAYRHLRMKK